MSVHYDAYGLVIDSDVELPLERHSTGMPTDGADLVIRRASARTVQQPVTGRTLVEHVRDGRRWYHGIRRTDGTVLLRFDNLCDMEIDADGHDVVVRVAPDGDEGVVTVLVAGALLAFVLTLRGDLVLHGSAVSMEHTAGARSIGFVGRSGMGKSTMAALVCRSGGSLVTDDILVLDRRAGVYVAQPGATEARLRPRAEALASELEEAGAPARPSGDARHALHLAGPRQDAVPLAALVVPFPDRTHDELRLQRLTARDASLTLMRFPRLSEWHDHSVTARHFADLVTLTRDVPLLLARVPWGPPFRHDIIEDLTTAVLNNRIPHASSLLGTATRAASPAPA
ncbi:hypothetical protein [Isoptericola croceus]|uniref:hypothetical protein n=1 Tax=Isoptericola croceus TaxID=3031406 RepID=UPI0023F88C4E|nr:hypothetical protein [Isoptericola croceus]